MRRCQVFPPRGVSIGSLAILLLALAWPLAAQTAPPTPTFVVRNSQPGGSFLWSITAGPPGLVTVGVGGTILSSTDGVTWTNRTSGTANWLVGVTYGGNQYVAVGDNGCVVLSPDGVTWSTVNQSATTARLNNVIYAAGQYVAVGEAGTIITSPDGRNWTARSSGLTGWLRALTYVGPFPYEYQTAGAFSPDLNGTEAARFVAAGEGGTIISSTDGITWGIEGSLFGNPLLGLPPGPPNPGYDLEALITTQSSLFAAVGSNGILAFNEWFQGDGTLALDGLNPPTEYLITNPILPVDFRGFVQGASAFFATGDNGTIATLSTVTYSLGDGIWTQVPSGTTADLVGAAAVGDSVFVVGDDETILQSVQPPDSRLTNLSCRANVGTGANELITGFVVGGRGTSGSEPMLIRGSGPALAPFGVVGTLSDPELQLYATAAGPHLVSTNTGWAGDPAISSAAAAVGAFPWMDASSHDAASLPVLGEGSYTANIFGEAGDTGVALTEIYDMTPAEAAGPATPRLTNLSARSQVGTGGNILIAGFVIGGSVPKTVLIRASGPALIPLGVPGTLPDPELQVSVNVPGAPPLATNTGWAGDVRIATAAAWVGAFSWGGAATPDSAILITLPPGAYTAGVFGASGDKGVALVEVYEVE